LDHNDATYGGDIFPSTIFPFQAYQLHLTFLLSCKYTQHKVVCKLTMVHESPLMVAHSDSTLLENIWGMQYLVVASLSTIVARYNVINVALQLQG